MSTSGSVDYSLVTNTIIEKMFHLLGVGSEGESLTARMYEDGRSTLNLLTKTWGTSEHLWLRTEASVTLVASQANYALATLFSKKPLRVLEVRRRDSSDIDTPLREMSREEYIGMTNKTTEAIPVSFYYDPQRATGTLYVWPTPSSTAASEFTLRLTYSRPIEDFDGTADDPDLPQEWLQALIYNGAADLEFEYPINDPARRQRLVNRAAELKAVLESFDTEPASLYLQPEFQ